jgi:hypothetical protein
VPVDILQAKIWSKELKASVVKWLIDGMGLGIYAKAGCATKE